MTLDEAAAKLAAQLPALIDPDQVVELRALRVADPARPDDRPGVWAGTFRGTELAELVTAALQLSGHAGGVYYTLNPLKPERLVEARPRVRRVSEGELAHDRDVLARRWVLVDVDPVRPANTSATAREKDAAREVLGRVREYLADLCDQRPVVSDSGNGFHLLYRLDRDQPVATLPTPDDDPLRQALRHLADRFSTDAATVDTSVFNPARIVKFPGTLTRKGPATADRPHRRAKLLEVPT